jgi:hypothetical protein
MEHNDVVFDTETILKERIVNETLLKDVANQIGSIYKMNAPNALGYLFSVSGSGKEIAHGMFCNRVSEISESSYDYFVDIPTQIFYKLYKAPKAIINEMKRRALIENT